MHCIRYLSLSAFEGRKVTVEIIRKRGMKKITKGIGYVLNDSMSEIIKCLQNNWRESNIYKENINT